MLNQVPGGSRSIQPGRDEHQALQGPGSREDRGFAQLFAPCGEGNLRQTAGCVVPVWLRDGDYRLHAGSPQILTPSTCLPHPPCCQSDPHTNAGGSPRSSARVRDTLSGGEGLCEGWKHFWLTGIPHSAEPNSALKHSGSAASVPGRSSQPCLESWFWFLYSCIHAFMYSCSS